VTRFFSGSDLPMVRAMVRARACVWSPGDAAEDFVMAVSEIAANAIDHGGGSGTLSLWHDDDHITCRVADTGPGMTDPAAGSTPPLLSAAGGFGLWLARRLTSSLLIDTSAAGTTVHLRLHHPRLAGTDSGR
jgi:anti-sigma regulatory factor (Ser/Thr protein kinase)